MNTIRYFTKDGLVGAARAGRQRGYNRQLDPAVLEAHLDATKVYPVTLAITHEHIAGKAAPLHYRVLVVVDESGQTLTLDISAERFAALDTAEIPENESAAK